MSTAKFIYDYPLHNADLFYATRFSGHDPIIFFEVRRKRYLAMNDLELDRAKLQAKVDRVLSLSTYVRLAKKRFSRPTLVDILDALFTDFKLTTLTVPQSTSFALVDGLRRKGYRVEKGGSPFYPQRYLKTREEKQWMEESQRAAFAAVRMVEEVLHKSTIRRDWLYYRGKRLTSEHVQQMIGVFLMERGFHANDPIVAGGEQACFPHENGHGPLKAHQAIVVDIFPKSIKTSYFGDTTRTFCKGRASEALKRLYATVLEGQKLGISMVRAGVNGRAIHEAIHALFSKRGFATGEHGGRMEGFIHGTGHSLGLEIHEEPARINSSNCILKKGHVMSVEPGLYYRSIGGVRIEDVVYVTERGCEVLSRYPKKLEVR